MNTTLIIAISGIIISIMSTLLVFMRYKYNYKWNKGKATSDLLLDLYLGNFNNSRIKFEKLIGQKNWTEGNYSDCEIVIKASEGFNELIENVDTILRVYTFLGVQCRHNIVDKQLIFLNFGYSIPRFYDWVLPYLYSKRESSRERHLHLEFEELALWIQKKLEKNSKKYAEIEKRNNIKLQKIRHKLTSGTKV